MARDALLIRTKAGVLLSLHRFWRSLITTRPFFEQSVALDPGCR